MMAENDFYLIGHGGRSSMSNEKGRNLKGGSVMASGDSAVLLKSIESNSVDSVITDPPY